MPFGAGLIHLMYCPPPSQLKLLPTMGGVREAYIRQFTRLLKLKALALAKYVGKLVNCPG